MKQDKKKSQSRPAGSVAAALQKQGSDKKAFACLRPRHETARPKTIRFAFALTLPRV